MIVKYAAPYLISGTTQGDITILDTKTTQSPPTALKYSFYGLITSLHTVPHSNPHHVLITTALGQSSLLSLTHLDSIDITIPTTENSISCALVGSWVPVSCQNSRSAPAVPSSPPPPPSSASSSSSSSSSSPSRVQVAVAGWSGQIKIYNIIFPKDLKETPAIEYLMTRKSADRVFALFALDLNMDGVLEVLAVGVGVSVLGWKGINAP